MPGAISLLEIFKILTPQEIARLTIKKRRVARSLIEEAEELEQFGIFKEPSLTEEEAEDDLFIEELVEEEVQSENKAKIIAFTKAKSSVHSQAINENEEESDEEVVLPIAAGDDIYRVIGTKRNRLSTKQKESVDSHNLNYTDKKIKREEVSTEFILNEKKKVEGAEKKLTLHQGVKNYQKMNSKDVSQNDNSDGPYKGVLLNKKQF